MFKKHCRYLLIKINPNSIDASSEDEMVFQEIKEDEERRVNKRRTSSIEKGLMEKLKE